MYVSGGVRAPSMPHRSLQNKKSCKNPECLSGWRKALLNKFKKRCLCNLEEKKKKARRGNNNKKEESDSAKVITGDDYKKKTETGLSRFAS